MMKLRMILATAAVALLALGCGFVTRADTFGSGANQFTLDFVTISGTTNPTSGYGIVNHDYRMGTYEITNDQWNKFTASHGAVTGSPSSAYDSIFYDWGTGTTNVPTNNVSWYETAQFVNWLNTSTGHQAAYKFMGTQGSSDYTFVGWIASDVGYDASNPYRNQNAYYFLPNENEWVKAAYWNGTSLQQYATKSGESLTQGHGTSTGWNYYDNGYATNPYGPWTVGSGSQELNGTYDMMGNNLEWLESPYNDVTFGAGSLRGVRGGDWYDISSYLPSSARGYSGDPTTENGGGIGFRVASIPEPGSLVLTAMIAVTGLLYYWRKHD
jgi:formylglycine-generating enzyme required for sulfatase activity